MPACRRWTGNLDEASETVSHEASETVSHEASETVSLEDFQTMLAFAVAHHPARVSFWSVNRDRPRPAPERECSAIAQVPFAFTTMLAGYHG